MAKGCADPPDRVAVPFHDIAVSGALPAPQVRDVAARPLRCRPPVLYLTESPRRPDQPGRLRAGQPAFPRRPSRRGDDGDQPVVYPLSLIHISEPTRLGMISYAV